MPTNKINPSPELTPSSNGDGVGRGNGGLGGGLTGGTPPVTLSIADQHDLLASIETRLTQEVVNLAAALISFGERTQAISKELASRADFGELITAFLSSGALQIAYALLKDIDKPFLLDDGAEYLRKLGLSCEDFIRELILEGRQFIAVALVDHELCQLGDSGKTADQNRNIHTPSQEL
jgi:hypothetical protein